MGNMKENSLRQRGDLLWQLILSHLRWQYRGSFLGALWPLINVLLNLLLYTLVFSVFLKAKPYIPEGANYDLPYSLVLFAGLIPFNLAANVLGQAPRLILNNPNYVKKVVFPLEILPLVIMGVELVTALISCLLLTIAVGLIVYRFPLTVLLLPLAALPLLLFIAGAAWLFASLGVYIRDIEGFVQAGLRIWFFLTPIVYPPDIVPENYRVLLFINPLTFIVSAFRDLILWNHLPDWRLYSLWTGIGLLTAVGGYIWFMKTKKGFIDVL